MRSNILAFFSAAALLGSLAPPAAAQFEPGGCAELPPGTATISGTVTSAASSNAVASSVFASAEFPGVGQQLFSGFAGFDGAFMIEVAAPATYVLSVLPVDQVHAPEFYDGALTRAGAMEIPVTEGQNVTGIDFTVLTGGTITGRVTAENGGAPLEGVGVSASVLGDLIHFTGAETDADGEYTLSGLASASYQLTFIPDPDGAARDYLAELYDDRLAFPGDPVSATAGSNVPNIDAALAAGGRIEGRVTGPGGAPLGSISVLATSSAMYPYGGASTDDAGDFSILVPSGSHRVLAHASEDFISEYYDDKPDAESADEVVVTAPDTVGNIDFQLAASGAISGQVTDAISDDPIPFAFVSVFDATTDIFVTSAVADTGGNYTASGNLASGQYKVAFSGPFGGLLAYADAFYQNATDLAGADPVTVTAPNTTPDIDQALVPCDQVTTTTLGGTTTTLGGTTTTLGGTTTTLGATTTTLGTTTTTLPTGERPCGDPVAVRNRSTSERRANVVTASDALFVLRAAVGSASCELCVCDVNGSGTVTASDALVVLRRAVGQPVELACPACT